MSEPVAPLGGRNAEPRLGLVITERGPLGQIALKAPALGDPAVSGAVEAVTGLPVPEPLGVRSGVAHRVVWMATDELLLLLPRDEVAGALETIAERLGGTHHMALDVSDARAVITLSGADAAETLAKGAPVDFRETAFPVGCARRTHLGGLAVGIWRLGPTDWEIVCFRSYAHHLFDWLAVAGTEGAEVGHLSGSPVA